jgi:lipoprotein-anchoring transpeptidase ErfK/SrfK
MALPSLNCYVRILSTCWYNADMNGKFTRRDFLKLSAAGLSSLAFRSYFGQGDDPQGDDLARVATNSVSVYSKPNDKSTILYQRKRDELVNIYYEVVSEDGPGYNPLWYRVWRGYIHSAHLQRVKVHFQEPTAPLPGKDGQLAEVSVPFTPTMRYLNYKKTWEPLYRLYYGSTHWVVALEEGPDGAPWYRLHDELTEIEYNTPAANMRLIPPEEMAPISPELSSWDKRIEVSIAQQTLIAYEGDKVVLKTRVSTGVPARRKIPGLIPTDTPTGKFNVFSKMPSKHMGNGQLTSDIEAYELPGVPWTIFFAEHGVALHGTFWHTNFGMTMSRGCVNLRTEEAKWLYRWTTPVAEPGTVEKRGYGTQVIVS